MPEKKNITPESNTLDSGTYEIIKKRLQNQKEDLISRLQKLNQQRKEVFASTDFKLLNNLRINTNNNCVARDLISFGKFCILGYNVHFGLKKDISISDVFSVYSFNGERFEESLPTLLEDPNFLNDYKNLFKYYRDSIFSKFHRTENYLYLIFQTSEKIEDRKAFKWLIKDHDLQYIDDRSIHEVEKANQFEFKWIKTTLEDRRLGVHPHVSILDKVFIEAINGDITFKIENNTKEGKGIYQEPVENKDQQLDDAQYHYADLINFIPIRIQPYQEEPRTFIFNNRTKEVIKLPLLNDSGILLPDSQGIIFPNGYYLQNGEYKVLDYELKDLEFVRKVASSNGEDFLYIFYQTHAHQYVLMSYNIINQTIETPIICNGYTVFNDGTLIYFKSEKEATKHHVVQVWQTPYGQELKFDIEKTQSPLFKIGNKSIVKGVAECNELIQLIGKNDSYESIYDDIAKKSKDIQDSYFWIKDKQTESLDIPLDQIHEIALTAIDEFEKVQKEKKKNSALLTEKKKEVESLSFKLKNIELDTLEGHVKLLAKNRQLQGEVISLQSLKYIDESSISELKEVLNNNNQILSEKTTEYLLKDEALKPYEQNISSIEENISSIKKVVEGLEVEKSIKELSSELELLIDILGSLKIQDTTQTTQIIEKITLIFSSINQIRAKLKKHIQSLKSQEVVADFHAQITLLEQSITNYLDLSDSPEKTDEYYLKASIQIEEIEGKFSEYDEFILKIADKREEIIKAFDLKKTQLTEKINNRTSALEQIGKRILKNINNKAKNLKTEQEIQSFFVTDLMTDKIHQIVEELKTLGDISKAENLESELKNNLEQSIRNLRDKNELYLDGENIVSLGKYKFSVNKQPLNLSIINRQNRLFYHLTGTGFYFPVEEGLEEYKRFWDQEVISENKQIYRAEYLAFQSYIENETKEQLIERARRDYTSGFIKGIHDLDAAQILEKLYQLTQNLGILKFSPEVRSKAWIFWQELAHEKREKLIMQITSAGLVLQVFPQSNNFQHVLDEIIDEYQNWNKNVHEQFDSLEVNIANYLFEELQNPQDFSLTSKAYAFSTELKEHLKNNGVYQNFQNEISNLSLDFTDRLALVKNWLLSFEQQKSNNPSKYIHEAATYILLEDNWNFQIVDSEDTILIKGLKGSHPTIQNDEYSQDFHQFFHKLEEFHKVNVPEYQVYQELKQKNVEVFKQELKIDELKPKVLSSFIRNKLINNVYLPLIGNNFAKQIGAAGDNKRTARMGMLLLVSPPGYGKTTLMEYLAKTLGLHFVKINGPTIGHNITSIDPSEARTSGAREELNKINLAFEMTDNVMLYLDDIQHCNPEFLQKFISLADGQRKMDGIFKGRSKTYDLRGKRFCIVMAGNPYTESGDKFQIPDMLANRADIYNLGDVIGDNADYFKLSLLENALIENTHLQKLSNKSIDDFYSLVEVIENDQEIDFSNLKAKHSSQEIEEYQSVIKKCLRVRDIVLKVNENYVKSAAMNDNYRTEPAFKLQGSYRDMNKMIGKIVPLMNDSEIERLILTHYESESQTLTSNAEANLLKLKELMDSLSSEEKIRWENIKEIFGKNNKLGAIDPTNEMGQVIAQMMNFNDTIEGIRKNLEPRA